MTATIMDYEVDIVVLDDIDLDLPCEAETPCDSKAKWRVRVRCCNNLWLLCQECVDEVIRQFTQYKDIRVRCAKCHKTILMRHFIGAVHRI